MAINVSDGVYRVHWFDIFSFKQKTCKAVTQPRDKEGRNLWTFDSKSSSQLQPSSQILSAPQACLMQMTRVQAFSSIPHPNRVKITSFIAMKLNMMAYRWRKKTIFFTLTHFLMHPEAFTKDLPKEHRPKDKKLQCLQDARLMSLMLDYSHVRRHYLQTLIFSDRLRFKSPLKSLLTMQVTRQFSSKK